MKIITDYVGQSGRHPHHNPSLDRLGAMALASVILTASGSALAQDQNDPRLKPPMVQTAIVEKATENQRAFTGIIKARVESNLGFRVGGKIIERLVDIGQQVKQGQPLMRLDDTDLKLALRAKDNAVMSAKASLTRATADEQRYKRLLVTGAASQHVYDQAKEAYDAAVAQLDAATADANFARNESSYAVLYADADGVVTDTSGEPGQVVAPGQTTVNLAHSGEREASVNLPETVRPALGSVATANVYGSDNTEVTARLRQLSNAADAATRTFEARYVLESAAEIPLGSTVKITINTAADTQEANAVQIPVGAIWDNGKQTGVWQVSGDTVAFKAIRLLKIGQETAVVSGLSTGTRIVAVGVNLLSDGMAVRSLNDKVASK
ncbi:efflux RND transporter periplasmic adaptor subunit [Rhizobium calliandrae]|uniref:Efflux RND transporter periplasmic adaptor subunit n=1 Tax=Rhizobium calliandrae TaxID=1312182 RepID=A0ABT7KCC1_9HYPH|nr:efflux RND transporter periplasmic adaptor subunit [Rhizobium calliandrae]MDL2406222.1 efflux RND transporter periplasmic adaptor subunit [Rhizobium calliandrae]